MHRLTKGNDRRPAAIGLPEVVQGYGVFSKSLTPGCNDPGSEWRDITLQYLSGEKVFVGDNVRCRGMGLGEKKPTEHCGRYRTRQRQPQMFCHTKHSTASLPVCALAQCNEQHLCHQAELEIVARCKGDAQLRPRKRNYRILNLRGRDLKNAER